jgi:MFS family permease
MAMGTQADGESAPAPARGQTAEAGPAAASPWPSARTAWFGVFMICIVTVFGNIDRGIMSLLVGSIKRDTGFTDTQLSLLLGAAYSITYMSLGLPMARISDARRRTFMLPGALAVWSLGTAFCGFAQNFTQFFAARMVIGAGECVKSPTSVSLIPDLVRRQHLPRAFGLFNLSVNLGESLALAVGGALLGWFAVHHLVVPGVGRIHDWQAVYLTLGIPGILFAIVFALTVKEPVRQGRKTRGSAPIGQVWHFFTRSDARWVLMPGLLSACLANIYLVGVGGWRPAFVERTYGMHASEYGPIMGLVSLAALPVGLTLGTLLAEKMARRWDDGHLRLVLFAELVALPIAISTPLMPSFELMMSCQFVASTLTLVMAPARQTAQMVITPNEMRSQINAVYMFTVGVIGQGLGPTVVALITDYVFQDEGSIRYAMVTTAAVAMPVMVLCSFIALKPYGALYRAAAATERH